MILHYVLNGIASAYEASDHTDINFGLQLIGFIFGVGLCEELTKLLPVLYRLKKNPDLAMADARLLGFVSGVGFGVAEAILYSYRQYNGTAPAIIYAVRFISVVPFHGLATATAAGLVVQHGLQHEWPATLQWRDLAKLVWVTLPVMVLHAVYDIFCVRGLGTSALVIELILFCLFAYQIERDRGFSFSSFIRKRLATR